MCSWCRRLQNCKHEPRERLTVESLCQMLGRKRLGRTGPVDSWVAYPIWGPGTPAFVWLTGSRKCTGPGSLVVQTVKDPPAMQETQCRSLDRRLPWRREWPPTPLFLLGEFHGQRSLHPWGCKRVGHEWVWLAWFSPQVIPMRRMSVSLLWGRFKAHQLPWALCGMISASTA